MIDVDAGSGAATRSTRQAYSINWRITYPSPTPGYYMLRSVDGSLYTGWTVDLQRRLVRHRAGAASHYTASRLPVELAWVEEIPDRGAARRKELLIKKLGRAEKLALLAAGSPRPPRNASRSSA